MIELHITETGKSYYPRDNYKTFSVHRRVFDCLTLAKDWLKVQYGNCKKSKMYRDRSDGTVEHIGYIFGFRNADYSHYPVDKWLQQDWVEFRESQPLNLERNREFDA